MDVQVGGEKRQRSRSPAAGAESGSSSASSSSSEHRRSRSRSPRSRSRSRSPSHSARSRSRSRARRRRVAEQEHRERKERRQRDGRNGWDRPPTLEQIAQQQAADAAGVSQTGPLHTPSTGTPASVAPTAAQQQPGSGHIHPSRAPPQPGMGGPPVSAYVPPGGGGGNQYHSGPGGPMGSGRGGSMGSGGAPDDAKMAAQVVHAEKQTRTIYMGNIKSHIQEVHIKLFLDGEVRGVSGRPGPESVDPVRSINLNHEKMWAFVELSSLDDADIALSLDGAILMGQPLRIRRPKTWTCPPGHTIKQWNKVKGVTPTHVEDGPNKIFLGGLPSALSDDQVKQFAATFGELAGFTVAKDPATGNSRGFAFFSYVDPSVTEDACNGLNGIELSGRAVTCKRANDGKAPQQQQQRGPPGGGSHNLGGGVGTGSNNQPLGPRNNAAAAFAQSLGGAPPQRYQPPPQQGPVATRIICMQNMVTISELADPEEYADILLDVKEEMSQYGKLVQLVIPRPPAASPAAAQDIGKIFAEFADVASAHKALQAIAGRKFAERTIMASFVAEGDWAQKQQ
jgi:splicing factor U2AF subunit